MKLNQIFAKFTENNVCEVCIKFLSQNDNSKNQIYLCEEFVQILPAHKTELKIQYSKKRKAEEYIFHNHLSFKWIMDKKKINAPNTKLIFYPQYPEARLSGFLLGAKGAPNDLVGAKNQISRVLFIGSDQEGNSFGLVQKLTSSLKSEIISDCLTWREPKSNQETKFFFKELYTEDPIIVISKAIRKIHKEGWISSCRLNKNGEKVSYNARNGGGYTLEAQLGIKPNSNAEPDYMGWEIKQHSIKTNVITLMTPDPDKGFAAEKGTKEFVKKYGYSDRSGKQNRLNFGGIYKNNKPPHHLTKLKLIISGYRDGKIVDHKGSIALVDSKDVKVAEWSFEKIMVHWTKKHLKAAFIPSENKTENKQIYYRYLKNISLGQNSKFTSFLELIDKGFIYLDPALKFETINEKEEIKTRYQFRIKKKDLPKLYQLFQEIEL